MWQNAVTILVLRSSSSYVRQTEGIESGRAGRVDVLIRLQDLRQRNPPLAVLRAHVHAWSRGALTSKPSVDSAGRASGYAGLPLRAYHRRGPHRGDQLGGSGGVRVDLVVATAADKHRQEVSVAARVLVP